MYDVFYLVSFFFLFSSVVVSCWELFKLVIFSSILFHLTIFIWFSFDCYVPSLQVCKFAVLWNCLFYLVSSACNPYSDQEICVINWFPVFIDLSCCCFVFLIIFFSTRIDLSFLTCLCMICWFSSFLHWFNWIQ